MKWPALIAAMVWGWKGGSLEDGSGGTNACVRCELGSTERKGVADES